jgi:hypothetical protein
MASISPIRVNDLAQHLEFEVDLSRQEFGRSLRVDYFPDNSIPLVKEVILFLVWGTFEVGSDLQPVSKEAAESINFSHIIVCGEF